MDAGRLHKLLLIAIERQEKLLDRVIELGTEAGICTYPDTGLRCKGCQCLPDRKAMH